MSWLAVGIHAAFVAFCLEHLPCVCIVITLLWCGVVFLADCGSWHFVPPPPTLIAVFISIYLFFLFIDSLLYSCFPLLSHLALV